MRTLAEDVELGVEGAGDPEARPPQRLARAGRSGRRPRARGRRRRSSRRPPGLRARWRRAARTRRSSIRCRPLLRCPGSAPLTPAPAPKPSAALPGRSGSSPPARRRDPPRRPSPAPLGIGEKPSLFWMTRPPAKFSSTTWATELFRPAAKTVTKVTSARPTISAAAVTAVRLGLRWCVLAGEPARQAPQPLQRPAGDRRKRRHQPRAEERDAEDDRRRRRRRPARRRYRPRRRRRARRGPSPGRRRRAATESSATRIRRRRVGGGSKACSAAIGGTLVERRAGTSEESTVTTTPIASETTTVRDSITSEVVGRSISNALSSALRQLAMQRPPTTPTIAPSTPIAERLDEDRREIWRREAPERAQHPELRHPLGDGDREGVEDQEAADEDRDEGEDEQEGLQEAEVVADFFGAAVGLSAAGLDPHAGGHLALDPSFQRASRDALLRRRRRSGRTGPPCGSAAGHSGAVDLGDRGAAEGGADRTW